MTNEKIIIDATNAPLGRLASFAAKQALLGKSVVILNCNSAFISGKRESILEKYRKARARGGSSLKGPNFPKNPERIIKRTIRGMLPYKQGRGREAFKRIFCYNSIPTQYENESKLSLQKSFNAKTISIKELSRRM